MRIKDMITNFRSSWLSIKFSLSVPKEMYKERCGENGFWCLGVKVQDQFVWNEWPNEWCGSVAVLKSIYWCKPVLYLTWINKEMTLMISTFPPLVLGLLIYHLNLTNQYGSRNESIRKRRELMTGSCQSCLLRFAAWKSNKCWLSENQPTDFYFIPAVKFSFKILKTY